MGIIAALFTDDAERGRIQGLVMGGIALGVLAGYPLGSLLYDFMDSKTPPFLVVVVLTVILGSKFAALVNLVMLLGVVALAGEWIQGDGGSSVGV